MSAEREMQIAEWLIIRRMKTDSHRGHREHRGITMSSAPSVFSVAIHPPRTRNRKPLYYGVRRPMAYANISRVVFLLRDSRYAQLYTSTSLTKESINPSLATVSPRASASSAALNRSQRRLASTSLSTYWLVRLRRLSKLKIGYPGSLCT